jgi:hypothetical protein
MRLIQRRFLIAKRCARSPETSLVIVCWVHNWPECPLNIDVVELCKVAREGPQIAQINSAANECEKGELGPANQGSKGWEEPAIALKESSTLKPR